MAKFNFPFVENYRGGFRYRRRVPDDVRDKIGKGSWTRNFPSRTPIATLECEAKRLAILHDREITVARGQEVSPAQIAEAESFARELLAGDRQNVYGYLELASQGDASPQTAAIVSALEHGGKYVPTSPLLSLALVQDVERYGGERDHRPIKYAVESFIAAVEDKSVTSISRADAAAWIASQNGLAPATVKRRLGALRALVNRTFLDLDHTGRNPFEKQPIKNSTGGASDRLPFNREMLAKIDSYLSNAKRLGHETVNILRIMRNTGAGPAEVGGLVLADVSLKGTVPFMWVRQNTLRGIKADARDRQIPLVGDALTSAKDAMKHAQGRAKGKSPDHVPLFTSFRTSGRKADSLSAKLNLAVRAAGIPKSPRLVAYSFRHTISEALRSAGTPDHIQRRLMGHAGAGVADRYGSPRARLSEARDALTAATDHLGDIDSSVYSEQERMK